LDDARVGGGVGGGDGVVQLVSPRLVSHGDAA
jgi:hypothetical protein